MNQTCSQAQVNRNASSQMSQMPGDYDKIPAPDASVSVQVSIKCHVQ